MKRTIKIGLLVVALVVVMPLPGPTQAEGRAGSITGTSRGLFTSGAVLGSVALESLEFSAGILFEAHGGAVGVFQSAMAGRPFLGQRREIQLEGTITNGVITSDGQVQFNGVATIDLAEGVTLTNVPFSVSMTANSLALSVDGTTLPAAALSGGAVVIE